MDKNDRFLNRVHTSGQMGWGKRPIQERPAEKVEPVGEAPLGTKDKEDKHVPRMDVTMEREMVERREASLPKATSPIPKGIVVPEAGKKAAARSFGLRLEDIKLHDWVNGTGEPVDPERKRMAGLKLNEKDMG